MKTKKIDKDTIVTVTAGWIDQSFDHEFGRQRQGFYEVTNVLINGVTIPFEILSYEWLEEMDNYVNE